jgi:hypothetical protein
MLQSTALTHKDSSEQISLQVLRNRFTSLREREREREMRLQGWVNNCEWIKK